MKKLYYSLCNLHLSEREYIVVENFNDGRKLIKFLTFANETITAFPNELDGSQKVACDKKLEEEKIRIAKEHGWN